MFVCKFGAFFDLPPPSVRTSYMEAPNGSEEECNDGNGCGHGQALSNARRFHRSARDFGVKYSVFFFFFRHLRFHLLQRVFRERGRVSESDVGLVGPGRRRDGVQLLTQEIALKRGR